MPPAPDPIVPFFSGAITFGFLVAGLFFLRFWRKTRDGLFLAFAAAFVLLGINQALLVFSGIPVEERSPLYLLRLTAFLLIIVAIIRKNAKG
ncbi:MAG: hypothetical protein JSS55_08135 [Proteobacteria bacterium]|nr:hypothetical protein [Pseudomonadota bacterium]